MTGAQPHIASVCPFCIEHGKAMAVEALAIVEHDIGTTLPVAEMARLGKLLARVVHGIEHDMDDLAIGELVATGRPA